MSQYFDPSALNALDDIPMNYPESEYLMRANILDDAMRKLGKAKPSAVSYPDYYDAILKQLIDLVPLE